MPKTKTTKKSKPQKAVKAKVKERYFEGVGRRKTAIARVRLLNQKEKANSANGKPLENYFPTKELQETVLSPLNLTEYSGKFSVSAKIKGGGVVSQAEAVRHGIARALVLFNADLRKKLKDAGYLKRDPRMRERKKFGLKRARRAPQWQKR